MPAITGARPRAMSTICLITRQCSSGVKVADSPVVPTATMPSLPCSKWNSTSRRKASSSSAVSGAAPERIGVTMATRLPVNMSSWRRVSAGTGRRGGGRRVPPLYSEPPLSNRERENK